MIIGLLFLILALNDKLKDDMDVGFLIATLIEVVLEAAFIYHAYGRFCTT